MRERTQDQRPHMSEDMRRKQERGKNQTAKHRVGKTSSRVDKGTGRGVDGGEDGEMNSGGSMWMWTAQE